MVYSISKRREKMTQVTIEAKIQKAFPGITLYQEGATVENPFSGASASLDRYAVSLYDLIKGAEMLGEYGTVRKGLDMFRQYYPSEYMTLLD
jgi:hypothetical protein